MEALLETLVLKLQRLSAPKLKAVLNFVEFLTWQDTQQPQQAPAPLQAPDHHDFETIADQLADDLSSFLNNQVPSLSDQATSRAGIYEDHP